MWLSEYETLPSHNRATGSFVFFRDYQTPEWTDQFAEMTLEFWFEQLDVSILVGMTPKPNRAARLFAVRSGLKYLTELKGWTSYNEQQCDALIAYLRRDEYRQRRAGG